MGASALRFLRPFILRVRSLDKSCFCMCTRPRVVPNASWEMFFFFLACGVGRTNQQLLAELSSQSWEMLSSGAPLWTAGTGLCRTGPPPGQGQPHLEGLGPPVGQLVQVVRGQMCPPQDQIEGRTDLLQLDPGRPAARLLQQGPAARSGVRTSGLVGAPTRAYL